MPQQGLTGSMPPGPQLSGSGMGSSGGIGSEQSDIGNIFNELTLSSSGNNLSDSVGGSRLSQWKLNSSGDSFAIGGNKGSGGKSGLGFGADDTWGIGASNSSSSGWPDSKPGVPSSVGIPSTTSAVTGSNSDTLNGMDTFGIPEFEPGKVMALKDYSFPKKIRFR